MYSFSLYRLLTILLLLFVVLLLVLLLVVVEVLGLRFGFENKDVLAEGVDTTTDGVDGRATDDVDGGTPGVSNNSDDDDDDDDDGDV